MSLLLKRVRNLGKSRGRKDSGESKREQDGPKDGAVASPAPPVTLSTANVQPEQGDVEDGTKASSSNVTEPHVPPSNPPVTDARVTPSSADAGAKEPPQPVTASTVKDISKASSSNVAQEQVPPSVLPVTDAQAGPAGADPGAKEPQQLTESAVQQTPALSTSQRLWNDAYDSLENDNDTAELVNSYTKTLTTVLKAEKAPDTSASGDSDVSAELKDPTKRQMHMKKLVEEGRTKVSTASKIMRGVGDVAQFILSAKGMIDLAIQNIPQAALPWAGVCVGLQILLNPAKATKSNLAGITHVVSRMDWYCALTEHLLNKDNIVIGNKSFEPILQQLENAVVALYKALLLYQMKSVCSYYRYQGLVFLRGLTNLDDWDGDLKSVTDAEDALQKDSDQYNNQHAKSLLRRLVELGGERQSLLGDIRQALRDYIALQKEMHMDDTDTKCLQALRVVDPRDDMKKIENKKDELLDDAYKWILRTREYAAFTNWSNDESDLSPCRLLWIKGHAGTGKTMLLIGIIRELSDQPFVLAPNLSYFFCQGTDRTLNTATATLRSLIWLLLVQQPHLISHLRKKYKDSGPDLFKDRNAFYALSEAFQSMLKDPRLLPVYFAVDALDECDQTKPGLEELIQLISTSFTLSDKVKWLVSSRPVVGVHAKLKNQDTSRTLVELDAQSLEGPVNAYIDHKLSTLKEKDGYDEDTLAKVSNEIRQRAMNTFLWVALVFKELDSVDGSYAVEIIEMIPPGLSELYDHMMTRIENGKMRDPQYCKNVLVATSLAYRPLSLSELAVLAGLPPKINPQTIVVKCGSFLTIKEKTVYLIHQSAKDYLDANHKSKLHQGGAVQGHADISRRSIDTMSTLKRNIYALPHSGFKLEDIKPPDPDPLAPIRYSCVFWIDHLCDAKSQSSEYRSELSDDGATFPFCRAHFLHWLESLSLLNKLSDGILLIRKLLHVVQSTSDSSSEFVRLLNDAEKFVLSYRSIIEQAPLQTYSAALAFCPTESEIKKQHWEERLPFLKTVIGIRESWDACLQTLEGHRGFVYAVAFSPDGTTLASASDDDTVRLWDPATGAHKKTLEGHRGSVSAVAFSPDGTTLASASDDGTVRLWDAATGTHKKMLQGYGWSVRAVAFSPDGTMLAWTSYDSTVRLWDAATGTHRKTLEGHSGSVNGVAFSPDGTTLASASDDGTVRIWDAATGAYRKTLEGHDGSVNAVVFSSDGTMLASASVYDTVRLWDAATGTHRRTLEGHSGPVRAVAFSPDGATLASAPNDHTVRLWDAATGTHRKPLEGHNGSVYAVAFSPDGTTLASASDDNTVRIWDPATGAYRKTLEGHNGSVRDVAFSPDGTTLASASDDGTVRIWDAATGTHRKTLEGHDGSVNVVAFSPDGTTLASASYDHTERLWDAATGTHRKMLGGHGGIVNAVAFSLDGTTLASASGDRVRLWDAATSAHRKTLKGHNHSVNAVAFSPDGTTLASASYDHTVRLWDVATGAHRKTLEGHRGPVYAVAFSPDGTTLASASGDETVRLWDAATGAHKKTLQTNQSIYRLSFSEDGRLLKTGREWLSLNSDSSDTCQDQKLPTSIVFVSDDWITRDGKNVLWLPPDYRATCTASYNNMLVLGHASGQVTFLEFAPS